MTSNWRRGPLIAFAHLVSTGPFGSMLHQSDYVSDGVPLINPTNIVDESIVPDSDKQVAAAALSRLASYVLKAGDVVVGRRGEIGRCAVIGMAEEGWVCGTGCFFIRPRSTTDSHFLARLLRSPIYRDQLERASTGTTMKNMSNTTLAQLVVALPHLEEQRRIVAILDEAFESIATAKANAEKNLQNAREVFESYLAAVFSSRNEGWTDRSLHSLCRRITVGHVGSMANLYKPTGIPLLRSQNIRPFSVSMHNMVFIDEDFHAALGKSSLHAGDVAIVRTGYPGTAAVIPESLGVANCSDLVIVRPGPEIDAHFLAAFFNSAFGKGLVSGKVVGAAQKHFNVGSAKEVVLHLPPLADQQSIVVAADKLREATARLENIYARKNAALDELKRSLLRQAFSGNL